MNGLKLALLYSHIPNERGFCGPQEKKIIDLLYGFLVGENSEEEAVRKHLSEFVGAFSYYKLIAAKNNIKDPFDEKVVEAYWVGNKLLEKVTSSDIKEMIEREFVGEGKLSRKQAQELINKIPFGVKAHHSTHVFHVGSVTGRIVLRGQLLDLCRVCFGVVGEVKEKRLEVFYKPAVITKETKGLGSYKKDYVRRDIKVMPKVRGGDTISFHWQEACQVLSAEQKENLEKYTIHTLNLL